MASNDTEEQLKNLDKETIIRLFLAQKEQLENLDHTLQLVLEQLADLKRHRFGRSTERHETDGQILFMEIDGKIVFFNEAEAVAGDTGDEQDEEADNIPQPKPRKKKGKREEDLRGIPVVTVEHSMPHVYASQIEYICQNLKYRDNVVVSLHPHNDRGCGVADTEMGLLAGADRVEGTLFGNGERTGNVDVVTLAMNMYSQGVDPELDFSNMPEICEAYEKFTGMKVNERSPYAGALVFAAFSGSHQDAIAKGMHYREEHDPEHWTVPYLPIDPTDVNRNYDADVIRINSQSGKGGVGYILEHNFGLNLPAKMREAMGYAAKDESDHKNKELMPEEIFELFKKKFEGLTTPYNITEVHFKQVDGITAEVHTEYQGKKEVTYAAGNGRLNAVSNALKKAYGLKYDLITYQEHALEQSSSSRAIAYVGIRKPDGGLAWGAGVDQDIIRASIDALVTAINNR